MNLNLMKNLVDLDFGLELDVGQVLYNNVLYIIYYIFIYYIFRIYLFIIYL